MSRHCRRNPGGNWIEKASQWRAYETSCSGINNCKLSIQLSCYRSYRLEAWMGVLLDGIQQVPQDLLGWGRINWCCTRRDRRGADPGVVGCPGVVDRPDRIEKVDIVRLLPPPDTGDLRDFSDQMTDREVREWTAQYAVNYVMQAPRFNSMYAWFFISIPQITCYYVRILKFIYSVLGSIPPSLVALPRYNDSRDKNTK